MATEHVIVGLCSIEAVTVSLTQSHWVALTSTQERQENGGKKESGQILNALNTYPLYLQLDDFLVNIY